MNWRILLIAGVCLARSGFAEQQYYAATNMWEAAVGYANSSSPAMDANGTLYVTSCPGRLHAVNPDGSQRWVFKAGTEIVSSPAVGADGTIYFGCRDRRFYAVDKNGRKKWSFKTGGWIDASPAIGVDGTVYFGSWDKKFYALDSDGKKKWEFATGRQVTSSAAIDESGVVYFGSHDHKLYSLNPDGSKRWEYAAKGPVISSPAIGREGEIYFTSVDGELHALNADGSPRWNFHTGSITASSPVLGEDGTIFVSGNTNYYAVGADGKLKWERRIWEKPDVWLADSSGAALANGHVLFSSMDGRVMAIRQDADWVWLFWLYGPSLSSPLVGPDGNVYALGLYSPIYAIRRDVPLAKSSWPMFRANPQRTGRVADAK